MTDRTDRELLTLAAKAAGIGGPIVEAGRILYICNEQSPLGIWAPLTDDGDALRLAVKLGISVAQWMGNVSSLLPRANKEFNEEHGDDAHAATRRAIVRAAAALAEGKAP